MNHYLAIDIGASSGRHIVGFREGNAIRTREVFRFPNGVKQSHGHLVWDTEALFQNVLEGIRIAFSQYPNLQSLSVDTWGVDYVLLQGDREIFPVYAYRDPRTETAVSEIHSIVPAKRLYERTGCQFQPFNTLYQLRDDQANGRLDSASHLLMMPEYLLWRLCGVKVREYTNATTTGMVNAATGEFDRELIDAFGYPPHLFPPLSPPKTVLGNLLPEIAEAVGGNCKVVLCATHDTASAVEGMEIRGEIPYISSGTWSLLGVKIPTPITDENSRKSNFSNEGGVGYHRYQKNIMGLWLINELKKELYPNATFEEVTWLAQSSTCRAEVDANDPLFLSPKSMKRAFDTRAGGLKTPGDYFCCAYRSLAKCYQAALEELEANTGKHYDSLTIVGGGAKNEFLNRLTEEATKKKVIALPIEATALGNLKIQMEVP